MSFRKCTWGSALRENVSPPQAEWTKNVKIWSAVIPVKPAPSCRFVTGGAGRPLYQTVARRDSEKIIAFSIYDR